MATRLDATATEIFMSPSSSLGMDDLKVIFGSAFKEHRAKPAMLAEIDRQDGRHDPAATGSQNRVLGLAYRHLSRFGHQSEFGPLSRTLLASEGAFRYTGHIDPERLPRASLSGTATRCR